MEIPIKMDDLGGKPTIFGNTHVFRVQKTLYKFGPHPLESWKKNVDDDVLCGLTLKPKKDYCSSKGLY